MAATPALAFVKDADGRYLYANRQLLEQFGDRLGSDWFGKTDADIWPADIAAFVHE
jgi:PAS domain-containing protein